jgi:uncharacterized repeat protein (TIGR01451 family)
MALLVFAMLLLGAGQSWAIGTAADTTISNTASVQYTINGSTSTKNSNTENFVVDRKIRMVVTTNGNATVVAGSNDYVLPFTVTNESNSQAADTDYFRLTISADGTDNFDMNNVRLYLDVNNDGVLDVGDTLLYTGIGGAAYNQVIGNIVGTNSKKYLIVADCPAAGGAPDTGLPNLNSRYDLIATAWAGTVVGDGPLVADSDGNDQALSEIVFADGPGTAPGDGALNGQHSDRGIYSTLATIGVAKATVGNGSVSGYHIPGDVVTYNITVTNGDPTYPATSVIVTDAIPTNTTYDSFTACGGTKEWFNNNTAVWEVAEPATKSYVTQVRCTIANIAVSANSVVTFKVTIN